MNAFSDGSNCPDPLGYGEELRLALAEPALDAFADATAVPADEPARQAAYELARALGYCRVFGVDAGDADGTLPVNVALTAAEQLSDRVSDWIEQTRTLGEQWDQCESFEEAEELCLALVEARTDAWATFVGIDEALEAATDHSGPEDLTGRFQVAVDRLVDRLCEWDELLQQPKNLGLLATAADTALLENWRSALAEPFRRRPPWWLDGTLEAVAQQNWQQMCAELPRPQHLIAAVPFPKGISLKEHYCKILDWQLALAARPKQSLPTNVMEWRAPDKRYYAHMELDPDTPVWHIRFFTAQHDRATDLAGTIVRLDDVAATIDEEGKAIFPVEALRRSRRQLHLQVEPGDAPWELQD